MYQRKTSQWIKKKPNCSNANHIQYVSFDAKVGIKLKIPVLWLSFHKLHQRAQATEILLWGWYKLKAFLVFQLKFQRELALLKQMVGQNNLEILNAMEIVYIQLKPKRHLLRFVL